MTTAITKPTKYKHCIITPAIGAKGFDVFDGNGRWFNVPDQRRAKWWASIHSRLKSELRWTGRPIPQVQS